MLKQARLKKNISQFELSKLTNVSQSYISKLEKNETVISPTISKIIALASALDLDPVELAKYFIEKELKK